MTSAEDIYVGGGYLDKNPHLAEGTAPWKVGKIRRMMERHKLNPKRVIEAGCGTGLVLRHLAEAMPAIPRLDGYDISPQAIARAKESGQQLKQLHFHVGDATQASTERFDLMLMIDVFEHVEDYFGFLRSHRPVAKQTIFHIPLDMHVQGLLRDRQIGYRQSIGHLHYFSKATALATLEDTGYRVKDWFYTAGSLEVESIKSPKSRLLELPRRMLFALAPDLAVKLFGGWSMLVIADND
ncbi:methyltransferase domain-containing protein [bacterium]|nr:methyltransferase domain-containing protein [bacterium]